MSLPRNCKKQCLTFSHAAKGSSILLNWTSIITVLLFSPSHLSVTEFEDHSILTFLGGRYFTRKREREREGERGREGEREREGGGERERVCLRVCFRERKKVNMTGLQNRLKSGRKTNDKIQLKLSCPGSHTHTDTHRQYTLGHKYCTHTHTFRHHMRTRITHTRTHSVM